jgi:hypothetical protein
VPRHEYSAWNVGASYAAPDRYGNIVFGGSTAAFERLLAERLAPVFGSSIRLYGREGELLYTQYRALLGEKVAEATRSLAAADKRLQAIAPRLDPKHREALQQRCAELTTRLDAVAASAASPSAAEDAAKLLGAIEGLTWSVRYHELNLKLGGGG